MSIEKYCLVKLNKIFIRGRRKDSNRLILVEKFYCEENLSWHRKCPTRLGLKPNGSAVVFSKRR
jgi:hypothetical protein